MKLKSPTLKNKTTHWFELYQNNKWVRYAVGELDDETAITIINGSFSIDLLLTTSLDKRLVFEIRKPDGTYEEYEHPLLNIKPNYEVISTGGFSTTGMAFTQLDGFYINNYKIKNIDFVRDFQILNKYISKLEENGSNVADTLNEMSAAFFIAGKSHLSRSDEMGWMLDSSLFMKSYLDSPRVVATGIDLRNTNESRMYVNLINARSKVLPYPGQNPDFIEEYNTLRGITETIIEDTLFGPNGLSTPEIFTFATNQSIPILTLGNNPEDLMRLDSLNYSKQTKIKILNTLYSSGEVVVPERPVNINDSVYTRWYTIDAEGYAIDWNEDGYHGVWEFIDGVGRTTVNVLKWSYDHWKLVALLLELLIYIYKSSLLGIVMSLIVGLVAEPFTIGVVLGLMIGLVKEGFSATEISQVLRQLRVLIGHSFTFLVIASFLITLGALIRGDPPIMSTFFKTNKQEIVINLEGSEKLIDSIVFLPGTEDGTFIITSSNPLATIEYFTDTEIIYFG